MFRLKFISQKFIRRTYIINIAYCTSLCLVCFSIYFRVDMYYEGSRDFYAVFLAMVFTDENECLKKAKEVMVPKYFPVYEKV